MPKLASYMLAWSCSHQAYELYEGQRNNAVGAYPCGRPLLAPESDRPLAESSEWFVWVSQVSSFSFHGQDGSYTARKECKQRGEGYWYAYARAGEKLTKRYLGKGTDLTLARLEHVAQELWHCPQVALQQQEAIGGSRSLLASPRIEKQQASLFRHVNESQVSFPERSYLSNDLLLATKFHVPR